MLAAPTNAPSTVMAADHASQKVACTVNVCCPALSCGSLTTGNAVCPALSASLPRVPSSLLVSLVFKVNELLQKSYLHQP